jgi:type II secretory pathway component PulF
VDRVKLRAPLVGRLLRDVAVARFTRTLGTLVSAGIPILDALRITRDTLANSAMMHAIDAVQERVTSGAALAEPLERSGLFPPLLIQVVNLGERSGRLEVMLMHAATAFDRRVNSSIKRVRPGGHHPSAAVAAIGRAIKPLATRVRAPCQVGHV